MSTLLPDLPSVKPVRVPPKLNPVVENAEVKADDEGSMVSDPAPLKLLEPVVGASFCSTSAPPLSVVAPV